MGNTMWKKFSGSVVTEKVFESRFPIKDRGRGVDIEWERHRENFSRITTRDPEGKIWKNCFKEVVRE